MEFIIGFMQSWGYVAMFFAMALENANIPIPSEVVLGFAGYLISQGVFTFWPTVIIATLAGIVGSIVSYWMGQYGGRPLLIKYGKYMLFNERKFNLAEALFNRYGGCAVFIGRLLPGVRTFISFPAGVASYSMSRFILWTVIGTIPWTILLVWLGAKLGERWKDLIAYGHEFLLVTIIILAILVVYGIYRYIRWQRSQASKDSEDK